MQIIRILTQYARKVLTCDFVRGNINLRKAYIRKEVNDV